MVGRARTKRIPVFSRGRCPRTPAIPGFCALFVRSPRLAGGLLALCALRLRRAQGFGRFAPRFAPLPPSSLRAVARLPPPALALGGRGWVPSRPCRPLPAGASAAPCGGGWVAPFGRWFVFVGVCRGFFSLLLCAVSFGGRVFGPVRVRALGGRGPGRFVPPFLARLFRVCRGGAVFFVPRRCAVFRVLGWPLCPFGRVRVVLRGARCARRRWGGPVVVRVGSGGPAARSRSPGWRVAPLGRRVRRPVRSVAVCRGVVVSLFPAPAVVGFSGGRRLPVAFRPLVSGVVAAVLAAGRSVAVGCAPGADLFVRSAAPGALVFSASSFGSGRAAFAARSVALVRAVAAGGPGSGFVVFPAVPCPSGLSPSASPATCFCGLGSGSWASAAFAAGLGVPLVVFPCGFSALPPWGVWRPAAPAGVWARGWRLA